MSVCVSVREIWCMHVLHVHMQMHVRELEILAEYLFSIVPHFYFLRQGLLLNWKLIDLSRWVELQKASASALPLPALDSQTHVSTHGCLCEC